MTRLLIILLLIIGSVLIIMLLAIRFLKRFISGLFPGPVHFPEKEAKNDNILYHKDDITILKGEAGQIEEKQNKNE